MHFFSPISLGRLLDRCPVRIEKFFTVTNHDETFAAVADLFDRDYAEKQLKSWQERGEPARGERADYPAYCGENSALYAVKTAATPPRMSRLASFVARVWGKVFANNQVDRADVTQIRRIHAYLVQVRPMVGPAPLPMSNRSTTSATRPGALRLPEEVAQKRSTAAPLAVTGAAWPSSVHDPQAGNYISTCCCDLL